MFIISKLNLKKFNLEKTANYIFILGVFLLPSSLFLGLLFLLPVSIFSSIYKRDNYFKDLWNIPFFISGFIMTLNTFLHYLNVNESVKDIWNPNLSLYGLGNWLPFFWIFWSFIPFVNSPKKRKRFANALIAGSLPVLVSGFGQYYFNWTGPLQIFNGLIIWYQHPLGSSNAMTGLFSNPNYTGSWLNLVWPLCIATVLEKSKNLFNKSVAISFLLSIGLAIYLTNSRAGWTGLLVSLPIVIGQRGLIWVLPLFLILSGSIIYAISPLFSGEIQDIIRSIIPENILKINSKIAFEGLDANRLEILLSAFKIIRIEPLIGLGAASFTVLYYSKTGFWKGHSHNLLTELAISYGIPVTIIIFTTISILLLISGYVIFIKKNYNDFFERAFWTSILFFLISQTVDIQYFDGKISLIFWILLASLKCIINENNFSFKSP